MPPSLTLEDIEAIGRGVSDRTLPKVQWTHAAHFACALWVLTHPTLDAAGDLPDMIRAYNEATGVRNTDTEGYHETITQASIRAARAWLDARPGMALDEALAGLLASDHGRSGWPLAYWSKDVLFSVEARRGWMEPDLRALPF